jgi:BASS family bile acid:Na+ symporter
MKLLQKYFWVIILLSLFVGFVWREPGLLLKNYLTPILVVMMTLSCLKIDLKELKNIKKDWWRYAFIVINIFFLSSLFIYFARHHLDRNIFLGLLVATSVPCGISVVSFSIIFGGQPTKALVATTIAHLLAPVVTPFVVWLFAREIVTVNFISMLVLMIKLLVIPIILAQIIRYLRLDRRIQNFVSPANTVLVSLLNWGTIAPVAMLVSFRNHPFLVSLLVVCAITAVQIILGMWFGRNREERITWSITNFYRNTGLAAVIAMTSFGTSPMLGVVAYVLVTNAVLAPFQLWTSYKTK